MKQSLLFLHHLLSLIEITIVNDNYFLKQDLYQILYAFKNNLSSYKTNDDLMEFDNIFNDNGWVNHCFRWFKESEDDEEQIFFGKIENDIFEPLTEKCVDK